MSLPDVLRLIFDFGTLGVSVATGNPIGIALGTSFLAADLFRSGGAGEAFWNTQYASEAEFWTDEFGWTYSHSPRPGFRQSQFPGPDGRVYYYRPAGSWDGSNAYISALYSSGGSSYGGSYSPPVMLESPEEVTVAGYVGQSVHDRPGNSFEDRVRLFGLAAESKMLGSRVLTRKTLVSPAEYHRRFTEFVAGQGAYTSRSVKPGLPVSAGKLTVR